MKKTFKLFGIIVFVAIFGFVMAACSDDNGALDGQLEKFVGVWIKNNRSSYPFIVEFSIVNHREHGVGLRDFDFEADLRYYDFIGAGSGESYFKGGTVEVDGNTVFYGGGLEATLTSNNTLTINNRQWSIDPYVGSYTRSDKIPDGTYINQSNNSCKAIIQGNTCALYLNDEYVYKGTYCIISGSSSEILICYRDSDYDELLDKSGGFFARINEDSFVIVRTDLWRIFSNDNVFSGTYLRQ